MSKDPTTIIVDVTKAFDTFRELFQKNLPGTAASTSRLTNAVISKIK